MGGNKMASCCSANRKAKLIGVGLSAFVVITAVVAGLYFARVFDEEPEPTEIIQHRGYLRNFLADAELTFTPATKNDFAYYELHTADQQLAGFVLLGTEEGWGGPINLFVKTDAAGVIQHVYVWHHTETPIYVVGMDAFLATFAGYKADAELIWQEDVHGITGATVTAEAIIAAVYGAGRAARQKGIFIQRE
ncbi:FMN-binding protein [Candidatus Bipolaricaulota bacterium]|nr:FMN-binding protein [Candidatus Bipolaricaulota bacterium]